MAFADPRALFAPVVEFFGLAETKRQLRAIPMEQRSHLATVVRLSRQRREAAETLWSAGSSAEGLKLLLDAHDLLARERPAEASDVLARLGASGAPTFDAEVSDAHIRLFEDLLREHRALLRLVVPLSREDRELKVLQLSRIVWTALIVVAVTVAAVTVQRWRNIPRAEASASFPGYEPARAVDGSVAAEWLLPDRSPGHLDLHLPRPRKVRRIRVINASNPPHHDRATKDYEIEVLRGGQVVRKFESTFADLDPKGTPQVFELNESKVELVRLNVKTFHKNGGGIAEVFIE